MRIDLITIASLAMLTSAPAFAATGAQTKTTPVPAPSAKGDDKGAATDISVPLQTALDDVAKKVTAKTVTKEDYSKVAQLVKERAKELSAENPHAAMLNERLIERINQLEARAQMAALDIMRIKDAQIDMEFESALARLKARAIAGKATREEYTKVADMLGRRAQAAKDYNPDVEAIVAKLSAAIAELQKRAASAAPKAEDFQSLAEQVTEIRISNAVALLEKKVAIKPVIMIDYDDVASAYEDYSKAVGTSDPSVAATGKKLTAKLDEMKKAGEIKKDDITALKAILVPKTREAGSPK